MEIEYMIASSHVTTHEIAAICKAEWDREQRLCTG